MWRFGLLTSAAAVTLSACATAPSATPTPAPAPSVTTAEQVSRITQNSAAWLALGTEPFWNVEITAAQIRFRDAEGRAITAANPGAQVNGATKSYTTPELKLTIQPQSCSDGMSDRRYSNSVRVETGGRVLNGCGGPLLPPTSLAETQWRIVGIDSETLTPAAERPATIAFTADRLSASAGCNRLMGSYQSDMQQLTAGPIASTRMACHGPAAAQEQRLIALLGQPLTLHFTAREQLIASTADGGRLVLERAH